MFHFLVIGFAGIGIGTVWVYSVIARRINRWADSIDVVFGLGEFLKSQQDKDQQ